MKLAIMQPYLFPYIGYFQLIYATDVFVFYDDVNYINKGWINRNKILVNGNEQLFTIPCKDASQNKLIKDVELLDDTKSNTKLMATIKMAYSKAPYFSDIYTLIGALFQKQDTTISQMAINSITSICEYLDLNRIFKVSSEQYTNQELKKADRLIDICHIEGIPNYVNAAGGKAIYTKEYYKANGIDIFFLGSDLIEYPQFKNPFVPWLSIIDILMFNSPAYITDVLLPSYHLD